MLAQVNEHQPIDNHQFRTEEAPMKYSQDSKHGPTRSSSITPTRLVLAALPASIMLALSSGGVMAQEQEAEAKTLAIEEVIVTAQRREQNLQDVPIAITAFDSATIVKAMFADISDYVTSAPNASVISNGARSRRQISIRGVTNFLGHESPNGTTGFYVDDFSVANSTINPPIFDIERIEILRGPQATYFGRNAIGGGISIITKKPGNVFEGSGMIDYSSFNTLDAEGVLNTPLIEDTLAMRFNVKSTTSDGYIKNINPIGGGNDSDYSYAKAALRWTPNENLTVDASFQYTEEEVGMREGIASGVFSLFAGDVLYAGLFPDRNGDGKSDPFIDTVGFYPQNRDRTNFGSPQSIGTDMRNGVVRTDYTTDNLLFTNITGYINSDFFLAGDIDGSSLDFFQEFRNLSRQSVSTEFRVQNTNDSDWQWSTGVLYAMDENESWNRTFVGAEQVFGLPDGFLIDADDSSEDTDTWAVFGQVDYLLNEQWTLTAGGRYSNEDKSTDIVGFSGALETIISAENSFTDFSPRIAATFKATDTMTWYGTISKGYKSGGVQIAPNPEAESYDPEELWNYEVGLKTDLWDQRARLNFALFYMDWTDMQVAYQENLINEDGDFVLYGGVNNADSATSKGAELTGTVLMTESITMNFGVGYLDATFDEFTALIDGANRVLDGETIPNSPKWTASADVEYGFNYNAEWSGYVRLEWKYRDEVKPDTFALIYSGFPWDVPSFNFFNLRVGAERNNLLLVVYADNLFDADYYTNAYQKAFASGIHLEPSYQSFGIRATYMFGN